MDSPSGSKSSGTGKGGASERRGSVQDSSMWDKGRARHCHVQVCEEHVAREAASRHISEPSSQGG